MTATVRRRPRPRRSRLARPVLLAAAALGVLGALAAPAAARGGDEPSESRVVLTGRVEVEPDERVDAVVIFDGPAVIDGTVEGPVVAFNGNVRIRGTVDEDVVAFNGRVTVESEAVVGGDVLSSKRPVVEAGARVDGDVERVNFPLLFSRLRRALWFGWWIAASISSFAFGALLLWLFPRVPAAALELARTRVGPSVAWGVVVGIGLPVASVLVLFSIVGIPLGLLGLLSLALLYMTGFVVASLCLGRLLVKEPTSVFLAFLAGWGILRAVDLVPFLGGLVTLGASIYGIGALTLAAWRSQGRRLTPPAPGPDVPEWPAPAAGPTAEPPAPGSGT